jgi:sirohydrochlorin ferrochelatase
MIQTPKEAIILIGHGSRIPLANQDMDRVALGLRDRLPTTLVETCVLTAPGPYLHDIFKKCVDSGAEKITVVPYFLYMGVHIRDDIPRMLKEEARLYPFVRIILSPYLGYDELLVELVIKRAEESRDMHDIRSTAS